MLSFTERMAQGREMAQAARNLGRNTGSRAGCSYPKRAANFYGDAHSWEWLCNEARREWRVTCLNARNDFATACLNYATAADDAAFIEQNGGF